MFWKGIPKLLMLTLLAMVLAGCANYSFEYDPYRAAQQPALNTD